MRIFGFQSFEAVLVPHMFQSYALVITHVHGWKFVYSGDTRPSDTLCKVGENATVLIHESTFADELEEEAIAKHHSTISDAIDAGKKFVSSHFAFLHSHLYSCLCVFACMSACMSACMCVGWERIERF
jgi:ribonuclease Z